MAEEESIDDQVKQLKDRIQKLEEENRKWMRLAGINRLTELPNSLMLYQIALPRELNKEVETPILLACFLISPDGLGEINQQFGRIVGDQLIKQIGNFLKQQKEPEEYLFHCDGANFAILIPGTSEGHAMRRATLVKNQFRRATFSAGGRTFPSLTCSVGIAEIEGAIEKTNITESVERLYHGLCNRLYEAKGRGGNFVVGPPKK